MRGGSGIPKVAGTGRKREDFRNISLYFATDMGQRDGNHHKKGQETEVKDTGSGIFRPPCPHSHFKQFVIPKNVHPCNFLNLTFYGWNFSTCV